MITPLCSWSSPTETAAAIVVAWERAWYGNTATPQARVALQERIAAALVERDAQRAEVVAVCERLQREEVELRTMLEQWRMLAMDVINTPTDAVP